MNVGRMKAIGQGRQVQVVERTKAGLEALGKVSTDQAKNLIGNVRKYMDGAPKTKFAVFA